MTTTDGNDDRNGWPAWARPLTAEEITALERDGCLPGQRLLTDAEIAAVERGATCPTPAPTPPEGTPDA